MRKSYTYITHPVAIIAIQIAFLIIAITCENRFIAYMYRTQRAAQQLAQVKKQHMHIAHQFHMIRNRSDIQTYAVQQLHFVPIKLSSIKRLYEHTTA